jgi:DNA-binding IclR family transcriptional regulator
VKLTSLHRALGEAQIIEYRDDETGHVVKSAGRALRILELFDVLRRESLVSEVSELLDLPQSSTSVLLRSMVLMGYLKFNPETRAFGPTIRVSLLGNWINGPDVGGKNLIKLMEQVNVKTGQAVVLAVRNRTWSEYIHVLQATDTLRMFLIKGARRPLVTSGTGLALLTGLSDREIKRLTLRHNAETDGNICMSTLLDRVNLARSQGWTSSYDSVTPGGGIIAIPLPQYGNEQKMVLGVGGLTDVLIKREAEFVAIMQETIATNFKEPIELADPLPV